MWDVEAKTKTSICLDCHKKIEEMNDCAHGEVQVSMRETFGVTRMAFCADAVFFADVPCWYRCEHCGVGLKKKDLPPGVRVTHLTMGDQ